MQKMLNLVLARGNPTPAEIELAKCCDLLIDACKANDERVTKLENKQRTPLQNLGQNLHRISEFSRENKA